LEANRRLIVLASIAIFRSGTSLGGLENGLKIMPRNAILGCLKSLEGQGLIASRLQPSKTGEGMEIRLWYPAEDLEINFEI
jgi:hypothetical protein